MQVCHLSAPVLLCGPRPRAAAAAARTVRSESQSRAVNHRNLRRIPVFSSTEKIFSCWKSQTHSGGFNVFTQRKKGSSRVVPAEERRFHSYMCIVNDSKWTVIVEIK